VWAEDELRVHCPLASRAQRQIVEILEQVLLFQRPLKRLVQRLLRAQDQIQEQSRHKEEYDEECRENLGKDASASGFDVPKCPGDESKPECHQIGDSDRQEKLHASCGGFDHERFPLGEPISSTAAAKSSVPDTLESSDWEHKNAGSPRTLFSRTRDPELRLARVRTQRLDSSGTPAGSSSHQVQDITDLIVVHANDECRQAGIVDGRVSLDLGRGGANRGQV